MRIPSLQAASAADSRRSRRSFKASTAPDALTGRHLPPKIQDSLPDAAARRPPLLRREGNLIHIDNKHNQGHQPIIPFFVVIILLVCAVLAATFATICCWRSRRQRAAKAAEMGLGSSHRNSTAVSRPPSGGFALGLGLGSVGGGGGLRRGTMHRPSVSGGGGGPRYEIPTLVFQQHEPDTHGFFAPLYLDPQASRMTDRNGNPVNHEDAKREVRGVWSPRMLESKEHMSSSSSDGTDIDPKDKGLPPPPPTDEKEKKKDKEKDDGKDKDKDKEIGKDGWI